MSTSVAETNAAKLASINSDIDRIVQHQAAGRFDAAEAMIDDLLAKNPPYARLFHLKGLVLAQKGERAEAKALLREVLREESKDVTVMTDLGTLHAQDGELDEAIAQFRAAIEIAPNLPLAQANLGAAYLVKQEVGPAIKALEKAVELDDKVLDSLVNLAQAHVRISNFERAIDVLFRALVIDPQNAPVHAHLAHALFRHERPDTAEHHARRAMELAPDAVEPKMHLGNILASIGRLDEAAEVLLDAAKQAPRGLGALVRLVNLRKTTGGSPEFALLDAYKSLLDKYPDEPRSALLFALAKANSDMGRDEAAMDYYAQGNALTRKLHPYNDADAAARAERLMSLASPELLKRCSGAGLTDVAPIFICGMPRSGTTLMDQMFSRHPKVQAGGELSASVKAMARNGQLRAALEKEISPDALTADDFARLGEDYVAALHREGLRGEYVSDKMPGNYLFIPLLAAALPRARFLIMRRNPMDCLLSNYVQNFGANQTFSTSFESLGAVYRRFDQIARTWTDRLPQQVREVSYEDLVTDADGTMRGILEFVGLEWDEAVLDPSKSTRHVNTASFAQVRQPIYGTSVARWRRYGPLLKDLAAEVQDFLSDEDRQAAGLTDPA
ncbi:tetratricopeptide repeat-containing sulfotransferase family protein [Pacificoceanicola onchidii]|uniref:tetratricopeptide repeat-containing sulfotransferase family protein n=1 Tax=Pacificoceanicola onchidii TaxID=2562685 RepID=UPI0010A69B85|nr:tetratricopeptide repeat-containing sulfotransferase family protein [Pacificoceanicola onchidii]